MLTIEGVGTCRKKADVSNRFVKSRPAIIVKCSEVCTCCLYFVEKKRTGESDVFHTQSVTTLCISANNKLSGTLLFKGPCGSIMTAPASVK